MSDLPLIVNGDWLEANRNDPRLRIVDATTHMTFPEGDGYYSVNSGREAYAAEHIPGAVFADLLHDFADPDAAHTFTVPSSERFAEQAGALGIGDDSRVVVYDQAQGFWAMRLRWHLQLEGFDAVAVLEGGLPRWKGEGRPVTDEPAEYPPATFTARRRPHLLAERDDVLASIDDDSVVLINVLHDADFRGESRTYARPGRIPGSVHLFGGELLDPATGALRSTEELRPLFEGIGALDPDKRVVTYCGSGIGATLHSLALAKLGRDDTAVYDGSMTEWASDPDLPLVTGLD